MKANQLNLFVFFVAIMVGCSFWGVSFAATDGSRPSDFSISYQFTSGSVPPPYYYEYTISVTSSGQGEIVLTPDHAGESVPQWTQSFELNSQALDEIYNLLVSEEAFTSNWQQPTKPRLGAPSEVVQITSQGEQLQIPAQVIKNQMRSKDKVTKAIKALVPDTVWSTLKSQHNAYSDANYPDGTSK
ncbi:MAG: hypothetical protein PVI90_19175 [Desulfobacteraceae bacterium]